jgi:hypothetical protein
MANIKFSSLVADARGAVGGVVFSRGGGGAIARTNIKPVNPRTARQSTKRATLAMLTQYWASTLDEPERSAWRDYALGTSWTNKVGTAASISGMAAFLRTNSLLWDAIATIQENAPGELGHAGTPVFTFACDAVTQLLIIAVPGAPFEDLIAQSRVLFFQHAPTGVGRLALSPAKRYAGYGKGVPGGPSQFPLSLACKFRVETGQNVAVSGVLVDKWGRVGAAYAARALVATP